MRQMLFRYAVLTAALTLALLAPEARATSARPASAASAGCNDVSWLNPSSPPPFLVDIDQAPGSGLCQFQEFSNWNFMSLVLGGRPTFESWPTLPQVYPRTGSPTCSGAALGSFLVPSIRQAGAAVLKRLNEVRTKAGINTLAGPPVQATGEPLVDRNGRYIQYEMRVNSTFCQTVSACQLQVQACGAAAVNATPAFRWPSGGSGTPGAAEIKLAWRVMETCDLPDSPRPCTPDDLKLFFWTGPVTVDSLGPKFQGPAKVTIGLVGFHLMQKTPSRPEFMWATWEHVSNAPVCPGSDNSVCRDPSRASGGVSTPSHWNLYDPNVNPAQLNQPDYHPKSPQTQPNTDVCRLSPCGDGEQANIAELNQAMWSKLGTNVWANYFFVGSVWGQDAQPTGPADSVGSPWLANSTMETYFQTTPTSNPSFNCFTCHQSAPSGPPDINLDFVHSLQRAQQTGPCNVKNISQCVPSLPASHTTAGKAGGQ